MKADADTPALPLLQGLPAILPDGPIRALVLGSFPSVASLASEQYYASPQNRFWGVLAHCDVIADPDAPYAMRVAAVRRRGLAIWDLYARVRRQGSGDDRIRDAEPNAVGTLLAERGPFPILLNGRRAREWRRHFGELKADPVASCRRPAPGRCTGTRHGIPHGGACRMVRRTALRGNRGVAPGPRSLMKIVPRRRIRSAGTTADYAEPLRPVSSPARSISSLSTSRSTSARVRKLMLLLPTFALPSRPAYASAR